MPQASRPPFLNGRCVKMSSPPLTTPPSGPESDRIWSTNPRDTEASGLYGRSYKSMRIILDPVSMAIKLLTLDVNIHHCMHGLVVPWQLLVKIPV